jgi:uncharacterized membrane protein YphA (DoxX/SURF4 family)
MFVPPRRVLSRGIVVFLRVYLGVVLLVSGIPKVLATPPWTPQPQVESALAGRAHEFYRPFLRDVVLPRVSRFGLLIRWGEVLAGLALVTGTVTRLAAGLTIVMMVNHKFIKGAWFWESSNDGAYTMIALVVIIGAAGRSLGVDAWLANRWPRVWLW